jgi:sec-independent protein translocase protein TatA
MAGSLKHLQEVVMFGLGVTELSLILVLVLIIFGAGKLPEIGSGIGTGIRNFKKGINDEGSAAESLPMDSET